MILAAAAVIDFDTLVVRFSMAPDTLCFGVVSGVTRRIQKPTRLFDLRLGRYDVIW